MAASAAYSNPHVFAHAFGFSVRGFLALTKKSWFLEVPFKYFYRDKYLRTYQEALVGSF
jgi:hypothetical protein